LAGLALKETAPPINQYSGLTLFPPSWRERNLTERGYEFVSVIEAQTPAAAISQGVSRPG